MPKPNEAHKWISIDIVQNPYSVTSDRVASSDQYMLTIIDIRAKHFWIEQMPKNHWRTSLKR